MVTIVQMIGRCLVEDSCGLSGFKQLKTPWAPVTTKSGRQMTLWQLAESQRKSDETWDVILFSPQ